MWGAIGQCAAQQAQEDAGVAGKAAHLQRRPWPEPAEQNEHRVQRGVHLGKPAALLLLLLSTLLLLGPQPAVLLQLGSGCGELLQQEGVQCRVALEELGTCS